MRPLGLKTIKGTSFTYGYYNTIRTNELPKRGAHHAHVCDLRLYLGRVGSNGTTRLTATNAESKDPTRENETTTASSPELGVLTRGLTHLGPDGALLILVSHYDAFSIALGQTTPPQRHALDTTHPWEKTARELPSLVARELQRKPATRTTTPALRPMLSRRELFRLLTSAVSSRNLRLLLFVC